MCHYPVSNVSVLFTNIRSLIKKRDDLCSVIDSTDADIIVLIETWLSGKVRDCELFDRSKKYNIYRNDRQDRCGGGVLIAVGTQVESFCINATSDLEILWVCIGSHHNRWIMGVCYRPPSCSSLFVKALHASL